MKKTEVEGSIEYAGIEFDYTVTLTDFDVDMVEVEPAFGFDIPADFDALEHVKEIAAEHAQDKVRNGEVSYA